MLCSNSPRTRVPSGAFVLRNCASAICPPSCAYGPRLVEEEKMAASFMCGASRQRDIPAHLAKLRQRDMPARPALTACDLDWEHDSLQRDGRQCRCRSAFVLLAMIVVQIVAFDFENRPFHSTIFSIALSGIAAASGDQGLHSASSRFARAAYSGLCARAPQRRASRIMCRAASG